MKICMLKKLKFIMLTSLVLTKVLSTVSFFFSFSMSVCSYKENADFVAVSHHNPGLYYCNIQMLS